MSVASAISSTPTTSRNRSRTGQTGLACSIGASFGRGLASPSARELNNLSRLRAPCTAITRRIRRTWSHLLIRQLRAPLGTRHAGVAVLRFRCFDRDRLSCWIAAADKAPLQKTKVGTENRNLDSSSRSKLGSGARRRRPTSGSPPRLTQTSTCAFHVPSVAATAARRVPGEIPGLYVPLWEFCCPSVPLLGNADRRQRRWKCRFHGLFWVLAAGLEILQRCLSDSDVRAIVAYLRTVKPIKNKTEKSTYKIPLPAQYGPTVTSVPDMPRTDKAAYGRYLATALGHCMDCHTPMVNGRSDMAKVGAGGREFEAPGGGLITSTNLTPANDAGIAQWSDAQVKDAIAQGKRPDRALVPLMAFEWYKNISTDDLDALVAYLRTLKPATP